MIEKMSGKFTNLVIFVWQKIASKITWIFTIGLLALAFAASIYLPMTQWSVVLLSWLLAVAAFGFTIYLSLRLKRKS